MKIKVIRVFVCNPGRNFVTVKIVTDTPTYGLGDATHAGGITTMPRITDFASIYHVKTAPHGAPDLLPVRFAAHMHLNIWAPNCGIQEFVGPGNRQIREVFQQRVTIEGGAAHVSDKPGLGIEVDEDAAARYPYKRTYLPVCRLETGH